MLSPKNVQALRTLFNIAYRLHHLLDGAWVTVLENLNSLDRILESPSTTTQVQGTAALLQLSSSPHAAQSPAPVQVRKLVIRPPAPEDRLTCAAASRLGAGGCRCVEPARWSGAAQGWPDGRVLRRR